MTRPYLPRCWLFSLAGSSSPLAVFARAAYLKLPIWVISKAVGSSELRCSWLYVSAEQFIDLTGCRFISKLATLGDKVGSTRLTQTTRSGIYEIRRKSQQWLSYHTAASSFRLCVLTGSHTTLARLARRLCKGRLGPKLPDGECILEAIENPSLRSSFARRHLSYISGF